jgi:hypothetical protein
MLPRERHTVIMIMLLAVVILGLGLAVWLAMTGR